MARSRRHTDASKPGGPGKAVQDPSSDSPRSLGFASRLTVRLSQALSGSVHGASLAVFRIVFGIAVAWSMFAYLQPVGDTTLAGAVYSRVGWLFTYPGFAWVRPLPGPWLDWHFLITGVAGLCLAVGLFYRPAAVIVFLGYTWYLLLDQAYFNNHYYLISLLAFLLIWMPADRCWAVRWPRRPTDGRVPMWCVSLLRAQFLIVYLYAALAKFNADWLTGEPMIATGRTLLETAGRWLPLPASIEAIHVSQGLACIGLVFDLLIGFLLLLPRTRLLAVAMLGIFHGINQLTLPIGVFPFLGFTGSLIFLDPSWPVQLGRWLRAPRWISPDPNWCRWGAVVVPGLGALLGWRLPDDPANEDRSAKPTRLVVGLVAAWLVVQIAFPLRHFFIPGDASWTEEGQLFAWRMMLRQKTSGHITLHLEDASLFHRNGQGHPVPDWSRSPESTARAIYIPIDGPRFDWSDHPGLSTVFEGLVGYRTIYIPRTDQESELTGLAEHWSKKTGKTIQLQRGGALGSALSRAATAFQEQAKASGTDEAADLALLSTQALETYEKLPPAGDRREEGLSTLHGLLLTLGDRDRAGILSRELNQVRPFELSGAAPSDAPFYVVDQAATPEEQQSLSARLGKPESYVVWCDFTRLRPSAWKVLPAWFPVHEQGELTVLWNSFHDLSIRQTEALAAQPYLIRQYAREIARRWEQGCGRRPAVRAYTSVMMNYRYPRSLVDPAADMAAVEYSHWRHNPWILPMDDRKVDIAEQVERGRRR